MTGWGGLFAVLLLVSMVAVAACDGDETASPQATATPATGGTMTGTAGTPPPSEGPGRGSPTAGPPQGTIEINGATFPLGLGTYCWATARGGQCVDAIGVITAFPYAEAAPGADVVLAGPLSQLNLNIELVRFGPAPAEPISEQPDWQAWQPARENGVELVPAGHTITLPDDLEPGRYLLEINMRRADVVGHSATYGAIVEVVSE